MVGMNVCCIDGNACTSTVGIDLCVDPFLQSDREDTEAPTMMILNRLLPGEKLRRRR